MATIAQQIDAERRMRDLLEDNHLPQPDRVEYGFHCIRLFFDAAMQVVVIDIDPPEAAPGGDDVDAA